MNENQFYHPNGQKMPNSYRWFVGQGTTNFTPWHFEYELSKKDSIANQFHKENLEGRKVITIMRRQDCDDFAGFELVKGKITERVIYFHPSFGSRKNPGIIRGVFNNLFSFIKEVVLKDFEEWAKTDDFEFYIERFKK